MPWPDFEKMTWLPHGGGSRPSPQVGVWQKNAVLHEFLVDLTGRYLACARGDLHSPIDFTYCLFVERGQADGFLRLDVNGTIVVAGFDREKTSPEQVSSVALRYASLRDSELRASFTPLITVGATERYAYYITSFEGLRMTHPDLIKAALRFTAEYLVLPGCNGDNEAALAYARGIANGADPHSVLDLEPLVAMLIASTPAEAQPQARREFGRGLVSILEGRR